MPGSALNGRSGTPPARPKGGLRDTSARLTAALVQVAENEPDHPIVIRNVQCLGGCPDEGVVAVDGPEKGRVRFTGLHETDAKPSRSPSSPTTPAPPEHRRTGRPR